MGTGDALYSVVELVPEAMLVQFAQCFVCAPSLFRVFLGGNCRASQPNVDVFIFFRTFLLEGLKHE